MFKTMECASCGAPVQVDASGRGQCQYCHSVIFDTAAVQTLTLTELNEATQRVAGELKIVRLRDEARKLQQAIQAQRRVVGNAQAAHDTAVQTEMRRHKGDRDAEGAVGLIAALMVAWGLMAAGMGGAFVAVVFWIVLFGCAQGSGMLVRSLFSNGVETKRSRAILEAEHEKLATLTASLAALRRGIDGLERRL